MNKIEQLQEFVRNKYVWPGGYPLYAITDDGGVLCHECAKDNYRIIRESQRDNCHDGWQVDSVDVNWEDTQLQCDNCYRTIESAYGEI